MSDVSAETTIVPISTLARLCAERDRRIDLCNNGHDHGRSDAEIDRLADRAWESEVAILGCPSASLEDVLRKYRILLDLLHLTPEAAADGAEPDLSARYVLSIWQDLTRLVRDGRGRL